MAKQLPIEVMSVGTWNDIKFNLSDLKEMASNFQKLKGVIKPPIKLGHTKGHTTDETGAPAYGWIESLKVVGNKLLAYADNIPKLLLNAIKAKSYRRVSSEIYFDYEYNGKKYGKVFSALALLGAEAPAVKDLEDLQAYLTQNTENGTFGKVMAFSAPSEFKIDEDKGEDMESKEFQAKLDDITNKLAKLTEANTTLAAENEKLKSDKDKMKKQAFEDLKTKNKDSLQAFCDEQVEAGKMLPAQRDALIKDDTLCFSEKGEVTITLEQFKGFVTLAEKVLDKKQRAKEDGGDGETFHDVQTEVDAKVTKFMADKNEKDYTVAMEAVLDADKDLAKRYSNNYAAREEEE